jgi:Rv0078B-related antitoxin
MDVRARLRREHPGADEAEIDRLIRTWLHTRPGAEDGDSSGRLRQVDLEAT